jgi:hypothetical protein
MALGSVRTISSERRHSLVARGVPIDKVADVVGHKSIAERRVNRI